MNSTTITKTIPFSGPRRSLNEDRPESSNPIVRFFSRRMPEEEALRLEEIIDIDRDVQIFSQREAQILNPAILYKQGLFLRKTGLYKGYQEAAVSVTDGNTITLDILSMQGNRELSKKDYKLMHLGMLAIGIKGMIKKGTGTKALIVLYDSRFSDMEQATIALTEVDLSNNIGIFYCSPDFLMKKTEFAKFIKIGIQVRGFESMTQGLVDNLWASAHRENKAYLIACINALVNFFDNDKKNFKYYVITRGRIQGIFHSWVEVMAQTEGIQNPQYKGFHNLQEAHKVCRDLIGINYFVSPSIPLKTTDLYNTISPQTLTKLFFVIIVQRWINPSHTCKNSYGEKTVTLVSYTKKMEDS